MLLLNDFKQLVLVELVATWIVSHRLELLEGSVRLTESLLWSVSRIVAVSDVVSRFAQCHVRP